MSRATHGHSAAAESADGRGPRTWGVTILLLMAAGVVLRLLELGQQSYWVDEIRSVFSVTSSTQNSWAYAIWSVHGPLHLVLLKLWVLLFGHGEAATRSLSALLGIAALPLFYRAALPLLGGRAAGFALALLVFSPFHLWYSQETRNYALLFDVSLVAVPLYVAEIERQGRGSFAAALAVTLASCLSNLSGFFLLAIYGLLALTLGRAHHYPLARIIALGLLTALLLSPWVVHAPLDVSAPRYGRAGLSAETVLRGESPAGFLSIPFTFYIFSVGHSTGPSIHELKMDHWQALAPHLPTLLPTLALFAGAAAYGAWTILRERRKALLLGIWLVVPVLLMAALALFNLKAPNPRYALPAFAPFLMLVGLGAASLHQRWARGFVLGLLLAVSARADVEYFTNPRYWRPDGRSVGALLATESRPGDLVLSCGVPEPLAYYAPAQLEIVPRPAPRTPESADAISAWMIQSTAGRERVWYVKIDSFWGDPKFNLLRACEARLIPDGQWEFEKALVARFLVPPDSVATRQGAR